MPIYDYYCRHCHGQFSHLARRIGEAAPACPRCGSRGVERLVTAAHLVHGADHHQEQLRSDAARVAEDDVQGAAEFLRSSGRLADTPGLYGSRAYRELLDRRAEGATDQDLTDLVDDLVTSVQASEAAQMAGALVLADDVDARLRAAGPAEAHQEEDAPASDDDAARKSRKETGKGSSSRRSADKLGWG